MNHCVKMEKEKLDSSDIPHRYFLTCSCKRRIFVGYDNNMSAAREAAKAFDTHAKEIAPATLMLMQ